MVMELYWLRKTKVLFAVYWAATAGNTRSSPIVGGKSFTQLAAVDQLASVPPPSHVFTAACVAVDSVNRSKNRNARFIIAPQKYKTCAFRPNYHSLFPIGINFVQVRPIFAFKGYKDNRAPKPRRHCIGRKTMTFRSLAAVLGVTLSSLFYSLSINAQGVIIPIVCEMRPCRPRPIPQPIPNALPVKSIELDTKINGQVATTHVEQVFRNDTPYTLEGTYFFPIPETASIVEFSIWENGKKLVGEVRSREEARRIYDEIVRRQRDPGLLEYAGKDLFQASIFPIPPNSDKKLELVYSQILKADSGTVSYRYPLGTGRNLWQRQIGVEGGVRAQNVPQQFGTVSGKIEITGKEAL